MRTASRPSRIRKALVTFALALGALGALATSASAAFEIESFDGEVTANEAGDTYTQAGGHPYGVSTTFRFTTGSNSKIEENVKDIQVDVPPGLVGNPQATPKCTFASFTFEECSSSTQVGTLTIFRNAKTAQAKVPIFNLVPRAGVPAQFGANIIGVYAIINASVRTGGDYGLTTTVSGIATGTPIYGALVNLWGVPASPTHEAERICTGEERPPWNGGPACESGVAPKPFLTLPTSCLGPQTTFLAVDTWQDPDERESASFVSHDKAGSPIGVTGCDRPDFTPSIKVRPDASSTDSPSGVHVALHVPQNENPEGLAEATLKDAEVTLPEGVTINPAAANGLSGCSEAEIGLHSLDPVECPDSSKLGTVEVDTPLLESPMKGAVYQAEQDENPFGSLVALYVAVEGSGVTVKLAGEVGLDPDTGQVVASFEDNPQLPFEDFTLDFFGGPNAALKLPDSCGTYTTHYKLTPWSGTGPVEGGSSFEVDKGCDSGGFDPSMNAGVTNPVAGGFSPFVFNATRDDGEQNIEALDIDLPEGLSAKLAGVPLCSDADAADGDCPSATRVGTVAAAVGAGNRPLWVPQPGKDPTAVYLAGPYKGGPYSIVAKVPAQAGPFDLGTVAVRSALEIDPRTAQVSVRSDDLPQILQGIPIDYRHIQVDVDRDRFMVNPTDCSPALVRSDIESDHGKVASQASRFQVGSCGDLDFDPRVALRLYGKANRGAYQALRAVVRPRPGDANISRTVVRMPHSAFLAQEHLKNICTRVQFRAEACPENSVYGRAIAWSPLLGFPLRGNVYLRSSDNELPDLVADLRGPSETPIRIELVGRTDSVRGALRNTFDVVPDAPVSYFRLQLAGGQKGLIVNSRNICRGRNNAVVGMNAHNGRRSIQRVALFNRRCAISARRAKRRRAAAKGQSASRSAGASVLGGRLAG